jgi:hypothetical protein
MKEGKPLPEDLRFVIDLDAQSLSCVDWAEALLQFAQDICVHGITSSRISAAGHRAVPDTTQYSQPANTSFC